MDGCRRKAGKMGEKMVHTYRKIEDAAVNGYKVVETGAVNWYRKIETRFVDAFLTGAPEKMAGPFREGGEA